MTIPRPSSMIVMNGEDNDQLRQGGVRRQPQEKTPMLAYNSGIGSGSSSSNDQHTSPNTFTVTESDSELSSSSEINDNASNISGSQVDTGNNESNDGDDDEDELRSSDRDTGIDQQGNDAKIISDREEDTAASAAAQPPSAAVTTSLSPSPVAISTATSSSTTTANYNSDNNDNQDRGVRFGNITIHELPMIVGDNPAVSVGPPVTVDWMPSGSSSWSNGCRSDNYENTNGTYAAAIVVSVDDYEKQRPVPRSKSQLRMPSSYRTELLRRQGFSRSEIMEGSKQAAVVRHRRKRTIELWHFEPAVEAVERVRRGILNATVKRAAKVAERQMLSKYVALDVDGIDGGPPSPGIPDGTSEAGSSSSITSSTKSKTANRYVRNSICVKSKDSIEMLQGRSTPFTEAGSSFVLTQQ